jgi:hypothetical protein
MEDFTGDLDDYQRYLLDEAKRNRETLRESLKPKSENELPRRSPRSGGDSGAPGKHSTDNCSIWPPPSVAMVTRSGC